MKVGKRGGGRCKRTEGGGGGTNYFCESITPNANEEIIYLSISNKLFTLSPRLCVFMCFRTTVD